MSNQIYVRIYYLLPPGYLNFGQATTKHFPPKTFLRKYVTQNRLKPVDDYCKNTIQTYVHTQNVHKQNVHDVQNV